MAEGGNQQNTGNKYGINRDLYKKAKQRAARGDGKEGEKRRFKLDAYYKIVGLITILIAASYCVIKALDQKGYMLINTAIQYWVWFALVIGVVLLAGRLISNIPKNAQTRKGLKICTAIITISVLFAIFTSCVQNIDMGWRQCAEIISDDGVNDIIVMRADLTVSATETDPEKVLTLYSAYQRRNSIFCDSATRGDVIVLIDGQDVELKKEWTAESLRLYVESSANEGMDSIEVPLK